MKTTSPQDLKPLLTAGGEIAFLDVREQGQYGEGHPFFSVPFPYSRLETLAATLLPAKNVPIVVFDNADGVAERAATVLESLGYFRDFFRSLSIIFHPRRKFCCRTSYFFSTCGGLLRDDNNTFGDTYNILNTIHLTFRRIQNLFR